MLARRAGDVCARFHLRSVLRQTVKDAQSGLVGFPRIDYYGRVLAQRSSQRSRNNCSLARPASVGGGERLDCAFYSVELPAVVHPIGADSDVAVRP